MKIIQTGKIFEIKDKYKNIGYVCKIKNIHNSYHPILFLFDNDFYLYKKDDWTIDVLKINYNYTNQPIPEEIKKNFKNYLIVNK